MSVRRAACGAGLVLGVATLILTSAEARATVLDPNWTESPWVTGPLNTTGMAWAPDGSGRLFLINQVGEIRIVKSGPPPMMLPTPFATISPIRAGAECGLIGIAFDPDFVNNHHVYFHICASLTEQQILRYTAVGDVGTEKTIVMPGLPTRGINHVGGAVGFGTDALLYWAIGDTGNGTGVDADLSTLACKVGRATIEGAVAPGNPFVDGPGGNNDYIWARGFRNPFTFTFQPTTGKLWVDVAGGSWEQVFVVESANHAGWDDYENNQPAGFITPVIKYHTNGTDIRNIAAVNGAVRAGNAVTFTATVPHGFRQGEKITISGVADASFNGSFYVAGASNAPTTTTFTVSQNGPNASSGGGTAETQNLGGAITGGAFYDATGAPAAYRGNFFFGDFNSGWIVRATVGPGTTVTSVDTFATGNTSSTDVSVGPDGALYYVGLGGDVVRAAYNAVSQGIVLSGTHLVLNEGGSVVFTVSLAKPPASNTTVTVARTGGSSDVSVSTGASLVFTPSNFSAPQAVILSAVDDADNLTDTATFTVSSTGLQPETVEVGVTETSGDAGVPAPGRIPNGSTVPGSPLTVKKNVMVPAMLDLHWSASCSGSANDYSVHEGTLGSWYSHQAILCSTGGGTQATISPAPGSRYYLVVPLDAVHEGSYGTDSSGNERPRSVVRCRSRRNTATCP